MQIKDYITLAISLISLFFSFGSLLFTIFNYRRNAARIKVQQLHFRPSPFGIKARPNLLYLDRAQDRKLWTVIPMLHLILYIKIDNLSYTGITISNFIINDHFLVSKINSGKIEDEMSLFHFSSKDTQKRDLEKYGHANEMSAVSLKADDYSIINIGDRIEPKSFIEGIIIISGNTDLYNAVNDGINKLTVVTPDKKIDAYIEIDRTVIPQFREKNDSE